MTTTLVQSLLSLLEGPTTAPAARFEPPAADEYDAYYGRYIEKVPPGDFVEFLRRQVTEVVTHFGGLTSDQADFAYAPGKWTVKEMLGHLIDTERVFVYRATSIGRQDPTPLPGYSQDDWMAPAAYGTRPLADILREWVVVRAATIALADGFPADAPLRRGTASNRPFSVRALLYVPAGHVEYHFDVLRERYRGAANWPG